jgi:hypothetical protein
MGARIEGSSVGARMVGNGGGGGGSGGGCFITRKLNHKHSFIIDNLLSINQL